VLDESDSRLDDSSGRSSDTGVLRFAAGANDGGSDLHWDWARQQKLSRLKMRQLIFS